MLKGMWLGGWISAVACVWPTASSGFVGAVLEYDSGVGFATEFGTGLGYTDTSTVLGAPNRDTSFGAVSPFNPPYERSELLSLGEGGLLTVRMASPVLNDPSHLFGIDFLIYGSAGFIDVDFPNGLTDDAATLFGQNSGVTRVYVSADNARFFVLDPVLAPTVDSLFPTDGAGTFGVPVDPSLEPADLANQTLAGIRGLYAGSAGGTGYDLAWARDELGQPVSLDSIEYIRIEVWSGRAEIDALTVVPEPGGAVWVAALSAVAFAVRRGVRLRRVKTISGAGV